MTRDYYLSLSRINHDSLENKICCFGLKLIFFLSILKEIKINRENRRGRVNIYINYYYYYYNSRHFLSRLNLKKLFNDTHTQN